MLVGTKAHQPDAQNAQWLASTVARIQHGGERCNVLSASQCQCAWGLHNAFLARTGNLAL